MRDTAILSVGFPLTKFYGLFCNFKVVLTTNEHYETRPRHDYANTAADKLP